MAHGHREDSFSKSKAAIHEVIKRGGKWGAPTKITPALEKIVAEMRKKSGLPYKQIAKECGISVGTVYKIVNEVFGR